MNLFEMFEQELPPEPTFITALEDFLPLCVGHLGLKQLPKITFQKNMDQPSFGSYDAETDQLTLAIHNRQPVDILRTLAHELVHARQRESDSINPGDGRTGSAIENQANAGAGVIMRLFSQRYPQYLTLPAVEIPSQLEEKRRRKKKSKPRSYGGYYGYYYGGTNTSTEHGGDSGGDGGGGGESVREGVPQPGQSSGAAQQFNPNAKIQTREMTLDQILNSVKGIPYVNNVVDDWDAKDYSWGVTKKVIEYAQYLQKNPQSVANLPPLVVIDGKLDDGAHRLSAINLLQKRMDPQNPLWKQVRLKVNFGTSADVATKQGVAEGLGKSALVGVLAAALSMVASPAQAEPSDAAKALGIYRTINRYKDYDRAALEGEARQELGNILRTIQGHPNQSKLLPIIKKMITSDENGTAPTRDEDLPPMTLPGDEVQENFADGKGPGRPGDSQRHGIPKGATMAQLEKAAKAPGRKGQLARWQINMRRGKNK
jgi:hypothetical protein